MRRKIKTGRDFILKDGVQASIIDLSQGSKKRFFLEINGVKHPVDDVIVIEGQTVIRYYVKTDLIESPITPSPLLESVA